MEWGMLVLFLATILLTMVMVWRMIRYPWSILTWTGVVAWCVWIRQFFWNMCKMGWRTAQLIVRSRQSPSSAIRSEGLHPISQILFSMYPVKILGCLPTQPVLFAVNYPNEFMEYNYYTIFEQHNIPIAMMMRTIHEMSAPRQLIFNSLFSEETYIPISKEGGSFAECKQSVQFHHLQGRSIWCYPEEGGSEKRPFEHCQLRSGTFRMAEELSIPVVPVVFSHLRFHSNIICIVGDAMRACASVMQYNTTEFFHHHLSWLHSLSCRP